MGAEIKDLYIEQGVDFTFDMTLTKFDGSLYDMDKYTVDGSIKIDTFTFIPTFTEIVSPYVVRMSLSALQTATFPKGVGRYVIEMVEDATGSRDRLVKGRMYIDEGV